jgi:hypothetical protein
VIADDGVDDEAPVASKLSAQAAKVFENVRVKRYAGTYFWWGHGWGD